MTHIDVSSPEVSDADLSRAGSVFRNRAFVYLWSAQVLSQLASNTVLAGLMATVYGTTQSNTANALLILTFLVPAVLFSTLGGVLVERSDARIILLATNVFRAVGVMLFIIVAPSTRDAIVPLIYVINFFVATATAVFAPAELTSIPRIVDRRHLMAANSIFILTINATFAIGFGFLGPLLLNTAGATAVYVVVAIMFGLAAAVQGAPQRRVAEVPAAFEEVDPGLRGQREAAQRVADVRVHFRLVARQPVEPRPARREAGVVGTEDDPIDPVPGRARRYCSTTIRQPALVGARHRGDRVGCHQPPLLALMPERSSSAW